MYSMYAVDGTGIPRFPKRCYGTVRLNQHRPWRYGEVMYKSYEVASAATLYPSSCAYTYRKHSGQWTSRSMQDLLGLSESKCTIYVPIIAYRQWILPIRPHKAPLSWRSSYLVEPALGMQVIGTTPQTFLFKYVLVFSHRSISVHNRMQHRLFIRLFSTASDCD